MEYLVTEADDIEWIGHRAGIGSNEPSKGVLERSIKFNVAKFADCAEYNYRTITDPSAIHTNDLIHYGAT